MGVSAEQVAAGQAVYTKRTLGAYDLIVLGLSNRLIWKCPSQRLLEHYNRHVTANHLDVGIGTGYFLDRCLFPSRPPRVALMDLNRNSLDFASRRLARYEPETYIQNVLEPIRIDAAKFDSVGINYLLRCIPGSIESKSLAFDLPQDADESGGGTLRFNFAPRRLARSWFAKRLMDFYNSKGIFSNENDDADGLKRALCQRFRSVSVEIVGCAALFSGTPF